MTLILMTEVIAIWRELTEDATSAVTITRRMMCQKLLKGAIRSKKEGLHRKDTRINSITTIWVWVVTNKIPLRRFPPIGIVQKVPSTINNTQQQASPPWLHGRPSKGVG